MRSRWWPRCCPTPPPRSTATVASRGREFDRRADGVALALLEAGAAAAGQGRPLPLQRPRVPRVAVRGVQGRPGPGQHQLPLHRRRARLPVGQRRRGRRRVPRHVRRARRRRSATGCPGQALALGRRRHRARARLGHALRGRGRRRHRPSAVAPLGPRRRRPAPALHRRHHRHAQGRHVAPGRPLPRATRTPSHPQYGDDTDLDLDAPSSLTGPGPVHVARLPADARHRLVHRRSWR